MTQIIADGMRDEYLARLDDAMRALPHGVAGEIRSGIAEELSGLDVDELSARIAALGDPDVIAREAQAQSEDAPAAVVPEPAKPPVTSGRTFAIVAAITLSVGGFMVPIIGWIVGAVLVCLSPLWKTWEKVVAIVVPFVTLVISAVIGGTFWGVAGFESSSSSGSGDAVTTVNNPLVPAVYDVMWSGALVAGALLVPLSGLWLLWRLRGRAVR